MQAEQRAPIEKSRFVPRDDLWVPFILREAQGEPERTPLEVDDEFRYVVVEDILDASIVFEISTWPRVDTDGRLVFSGTPREIYEGIDEAQAIVDAARADTGVMAADRPLRVGDVFAVKGLGRRRSLAPTEMWDISLAARNAAKAALYGAVASTVDESYAEEMAVIGEVEEADPRKGEIDVAQEPAGSHQARRLRAQKRGRS